MMYESDVVIVGGGMVGLSLACALAPSQLNITIINNGPIVQPLSATPELRVSAINHANQRQLSAVNAWQRLPAERLQAYTQMQVWDKDSFSDISFDAHDMGTPNLGHIVENQALVNALFDQCHAATNISIVEQSINKIHITGHQTMLMLENQEVVMGKLLVGADGANSVVRQHANFPLTFRDYDQHATVANVYCEHPHEGCARQIFTPTGPIALLPLAQANLCSLVWSQDVLAHQQTKPMDNAAFSKALTAASHNTLGNLQVTGERASFPLIMRYARQWTNERVCIIGDAAHTIHPLAGQGANLGLQDAWALADTIMKSLEQHKDYAALRNLRKFERARKTEAIAMIAAMQGFKELFAGAHPVKRLFRGLGLTVANHSSEIKRNLVMHAMGL